MDGKNAYWQMAIDEALLILRSEGKVLDTLRLYVFKPSAVTIGYFQRIRESVNLEFLESAKIDYTRRITGGGAVYHDAAGEVTYSVVLPASGPLVDIGESYRVICSGLVRALRRMGVNAEFVPVNDVVIGGRKVSGSAQTRRRGYLLQHGTLMYATNVEVLERALVVPSAKLQSKGVKSIRDRVVTLKDILGEVDVDSLVKNLAWGFAEALGREVLFGELGEEELRLAEKLVEKYRSRDWVFKR